MAKNPKILESVYSIRDIQIFGAGSRRMKEVDEANRNVNHASFWLTVHRQTIASFPNFFVYLARILILVCAGVLASRGINHPVGTIAISFAATASLSSTFNLTFVVTSLLETYGAAERIFKIEDTMSETEEPANPVSCGEIQTIEFSDVTFSYPGTEKKVLDHFNFKIRKGEKIGIAGASGAGKSTILRLLLRFYAPEERAALEEELYNVEQAANAAGELKDVYNKLMTGLCQMKDIRNSLRRCAAGETPDHVELFEIKGYLQRLDGMRPVFEQINAVTHFKGMTFHEVKDALAVLDPDGTGSRGFYIPDSATAKLKEIRTAKKEVEERLFHAQTDAEKDDLRLKRTRLCGEEDAEEMHVRKAMGAALAPMVDELLSDAETAGRLDFIIQKALFAVRYGGVKPELTEKDLELEDMINPEICDLLEQQGRRFVPVSISLTPGATVITGANMGGKSVAMKTVALNVLLLQAGFLVCAKKARMPLFHSVKMLFDDLQSIQSGLSGFGSEIVQFQKALSEVEQGYSLFLLDEFARGTNPDEGAVIVQAVTRYLNGVDAISLLTTHYDKVAEYARTHYQIIGLRDIDPEAIRRELAVTSEDGVAVIARHMNYGLYRVEGKSDCPRDALNICRMLSLKPEILKMVEESY